MNPETHPVPSDDSHTIELLEHPELWPDDPELQAELAELLELHLAMLSHGTISAN